MINQEIQILRSEHLNQIKDGLFTTDNKDLSNLVILQGPEGIGKTTLINNLGQQLESTDNPFLWIDLAKLKEEQDLLKYPQLLSHSIQTNHPSIKSRIEEAAMELGREAFRLEAMATQASAGTAVNADPLPDLAETWSKIFSEKLLSKIKNEGESELPSPTAIFLMEDFESFSKP
jgi:septin family protein